MSTPELPDDELDALFRQGFEHFPEERSLAEWWRLQEKLEAQALKQQVRRRVRRVVMVELLLLSLGALLWLAWPVMTRSIAQREPLAAGAPGRSHQPAPGAPAARFRRPAPGALAAPTSSSSAASVPQTAEPAVAVEAAEPAVSGSNPVPALSPSTPDRRAPAALRAAGQLDSLPTNDRKARPHQPREVGRAQPLPVRPARPGLSDESADARPAAGAGLALTSPRPAGQPIQLNTDARAMRSHQSSEQERAWSMASRPTASDPGHEPAATRRANVAEAALTGPTPGSRLPPDELLTGVVAQVVRPALAPVPAPLAELAIAPDQTLPVAPLYRLNIALVGATELSAVRFARLMPPGQSVGLKVEYQLTSRLRINTGVLRTNQIFDANGADYYMPASTGTPGATLMWVAGTAQVLDIPLNLRYDLLVRPRYGLFASAGLSSVLMRDERYRYEFRVNGQLEEAEASQANGSQHLFSDFNLSVGYERPLGQGRWSAQVEPFVKLPLSGVGMGRVLVSSAGVQFALKYGLLPARARH